MMKNLIMAVLLCSPCFSHAQMPAKGDPDLPVQRVGVDLSKRTAPSRAEYLGLLQTMKQKAAAKADPSDIARWESYIRDAKGSATADLAMSVMMEGGPLWLSAYLAAGHCAKAPTDAIAANNLGVIFQRLKEYDAAIKCLLYAESIIPDSAFVHNNLGWTAAYMGDLKTARLRFDKSLSVAAANPVALEGQAVLAFASGDRKAAMQYLSKQSDNAGARFSPKVATIAKAHFEDYWKKKKEDLMAGVTEDDGRNDWEVEVIFHAFSKHADYIKNQRLDLPELPAYICADASIVSKSASTVYQDGVRYQQQGQAALRSIGNNWSLALKSQPPIRKGNAITIPRSYAKEGFYLKLINAYLQQRSLLKGVYGAGKAKKASDPGDKLAWMSYCKYYNIVVPCKEQGNISDKLKEFGACGDDTKCREKVENKYCRLGTEAAEKYLPLLYSEWINEYQADCRFLNAYYSASSQILDLIHDQALNDMYNNARKANILNTFGGDLINWSQMSRVVTSGWSPTCSEAKGHSRSSGQNLHGGEIRVYPEPPLPSHPISFQFGFGSISADDQGLSVTLGSSASAAPELKWGRSDAGGQQVNNHEVTSFSICNTSFTFQGGQFIDQYTEGDGIPVVTNNARIVAQIGASGEAR